MTNAGTFIAFLLVIWVPYFLGLWLFWMDVPGQKPGVKRYEVFYRALKPKKGPKLCSDHGGKVAESKCVRCKAKRKWKI